MSYGGRGTTKGGVRADDHAIIFTEQQPVLIPGETKLSKHAIRVKPYSPQYKLEVASRLNYAKVYTVEYNVKVWFIGEVSKDSELKLLTSYKEIHPPIQARIHPPTLSSNSTASYFPDEPPSPSISPSQHIFFPYHTVPSATLSQSSGASVYPIVHQFSTGPRRGEGNPSWEIAHQKGYHEPVTPQRVASYPEVSAKERDTKSPKPKISNNEEL